MSCGGVCGLVLQFGPGAEERARHDRCDGRQRGQLLPSLWVRDAVAVGERAHDLGHGADVGRRRNALG